MVVLAILGIASGILIGLAQGRTDWIGYPPLYLVCAFPFVFAGSLTLFVTAVQLRRERHLHGVDRGTAHSTEWKLRGAGPGT
jgi:hypothetical protein